jgi:hypothetical protein
MVEDHGARTSIIGVLGYRVFRGSPSSCVARDE